MVEDLSKGYFNTFRCIAMDNYFTSVPLAQKLFENKISLIGTMRSNKNEVPESFMTLVSYTSKVCVLF